MTLVINDTTPQNQYTATGGQTQFTVTFEFFAVTDLKVYNGTCLLSYAASPGNAAQYSVTGAGSNGTKRITLGSPGATNGDVITIKRDIAVARTSDFPSSGPFNIETLNTELDMMTAMIAERENENIRGVRAATTDPTTVDMTLPVKATRASKVMAFDSDGDPTVSTLTLTALESQSTAAATSATASAGSATAAAASAVTAAAEASAANPKYTFSTSTSMAAPGAGTLRYNNGTVASCSAIAIDEQPADSGNPDIEAWIKSWDDSTSTIKGYLRLVEPGTPANYAVFHITSLADNSGWIQLNVTHVDSNGTFGNGDSIRVMFSRTGLKGDTGSTGSQGPAGAGVDTLTTRGDVLVQGASAAARLAIGGANTVLKSDGTDPGWGQVTNAMLAGSIDLTSKVTGVLPLANGGTGAANLAAANIVATNAINTFTKAQVPSTYTAALSATSGVLDYDTYTNFIITLAAGSNTLAAPTTEASQIGQCGVIIFVQPSSGSAATLSLHGDYETAAAAGITLSTANNDYDLVAYCVRADNSILLSQAQLNFG